MAAMGGCWRFSLRGAGCEVRGAGFEVRGAGCEVRGAGCEGVAAPVSINHWI